MSTSEGSGELTLIKMMHFSQGYCWKAVILSANCYYLAEALNF